MVHNSKGKDNIQRKHSLTPLSSNYPLSLPRYSVTSFLCVVLERFFTKNFTYFRSSLLSLTEDKCIIYAVLHLFYVALNVGNHFVSVLSVVQYFWNECTFILHSKSLNDGQLEIHSVTLVFILFMPFLGKKLLENCNKVKMRLKQPQYQDKGFAGTYCFQILSERMLVPRGHVFSIALNTNYLLFINSKKRMAFL